MRFLSRFTLIVLLGLGSIVSNTACVYDQNGNPAGPDTNRCTSGCFIRSANVCCPNGYLNYGGAGYGCYASRQACLNASGGKCWYETSCYP